MAKVNWHQIGTARTSLEALTLAGETLVKMVELTRSKKQEYALTLRTRTAPNPFQHVIEMSDMRTDGEFNSCTISYAVAALWYIHTHPATKEPCVRMPSPTDLETYLQQDAQDAYGLVLNCDPLYSTACTFTAEPDAYVPKGSQWSAPVDYVLRNDREREEFLRTPWKNIDLNQKIMDHMGSWGFPARIKQFTTDIGAAIALPKNQDHLADRIADENAW